MKTELVEMLIERLNYYKKCTKNSMVLGDDRILQGVDYFIESLIYINPSYLDNTVLNKIIINIRENHKSLNNYTLYAIESCKEIISYYMNSLTRVHSL